MNARAFDSWGTKLPYDRRSRDVLDFWLDEKELTAPLHWKKPRRVFPGSMTDVFGEWWTDEIIDKMMAVSALTQGRHLYLYLTKRADRMKEYLMSRSRSIEYWESAARSLGYTFKFAGIDGTMHSVCPFPLRNASVGFSAENQEEFDARWAHMRDLAKAGWKVWCSLEPLIGPVNVRGALRDGGLSWLVPGGESGHGARHLDVAWAADIIKAGKQFGIPVFTKQLGANPQEIAYPQAVTEAEAKGWQRAGWTRIHEQIDGRWVEHWRKYIRLKDRKGGAIEEWPENLRVRQYA